MGGEVVEIEDLKVLSVCAWDVGAPEFMPKSSAAAKTSRHLYPLYPFPRPGPGQP